MRRFQGIAWLLFTSGCVALLSAPVGAESNALNIKTGADLERICTSASEQDHKDCGAFVYTEVTVTAMMLEYRKSCVSYDPPKDISVDAAAKIVIDWLRNHRGQGDVQAGAVVDAAMKDTFPCKK